MKRILNYAIVTMAVIMTFSSCEEDLGGGTFVNDPEIFLNLSNTNLNPIPGQIINIQVQSTPGDFDLLGLTIQANGQNLDVNRIRINGNPASANPILIVSPDTNGFTWDVEITVQSNPELVTYSFIIQDSDGNSSSSNVEISTIPDVVTPAIISLGGDLMYMGAPGVKVKVPVSILAGTYPLKAIAVLDQDANPVDVSQIFYGDLLTPFTTNPMDIMEDDKLGFDIDIYINAHNGGLRTYTIAIEDENGDVQFQDFTIDAGATVSLLQGVLFNAGGPMGTGGLDLDLGESVGSSDADAEIKDEGIDIDEPMDKNWIRRISGANGSTVKHLIPNQNGLAESFNFDDIQTQEQLAAIWNNGLDFVDTNNVGEVISFRVELDDLFIVEANSKYYILKIVEINETPDNNQDNYVVDIKH